MDQPTDLDAIPPARRPIFKHLLDAPGYQERKTALARLLASKLRRPLTTDAPGMEVTEVVQLKAPPAAAPTGGIPHQPPHPSAVPPTAVSQQQQHDQQQAAQSTAGLQRMGIGADAANDQGLHAAAGSVSDAGITVRWVLRRCL